MSAFAINLFLGKVSTSKPYFSDVLHSESATRPDFGGEDNQHVPQCPVTCMTYQLIIKAKNMQKCGHYECLRDENNLQ